MDGCMKRHVIAMKQSALTSCAYQLYNFITRRLLSLNYYTAALLIDVQVQSTRRKANVENNCHLCLSLCLGSLYSSLSLSPSLSLSLSPSLSLPLSLSLSLSLCLCFSLPGSSSRCRLRASCSEPP